MMHGNNLLILVSIVLTTVLFFGHCFLLPSRDITIPKKLYSPVGKIYHYKNKVVLYEKKKDSDEAPLKSTKFSRIIDDFVGKKFGAGEAFYGKRTSTLSEEEYREYIRENFPSKYQSNEEVELKPNAILIIGDPEQEITQWTILELTDKGFKVRLLCEDSKKAIANFGNPGYNIDIVEITPDSLTNEIDRSVANVQAVMITTNFLPPFNPTKWSRLEEMARENFLWSKRILDRVKFAHDLGNANIMKVVFLSRYIPGFEIDSVKPRESILKTILATFEYLPSTINISNKIFDTFRKTHLDFETYVKSLQLEYVILRAPPTIIE